MSDGTIYETSHETAYEATMDWADGNALAGPLRELFTVDITTARGRCVACGRMQMVARTHVHNRAPGMVARCPDCSMVLVRLVRAPGRAWLDLSGLSSLEIAVPEPAPAGQPMIGR